MKLSEILKHPVVVVVLGVSYFFALQTVMPQSRAKSEIRAAYQELQDIAEDLAETDEPGHIKEIVHNFSGQVVEGFKSGFAADNSKLLKFNEAKANIHLTDVKKVKSGWKTKEKIVGKITNASAYPITQIKINFASFSKDGKLIDVNSAWLSNIKILNPNESAFFEAGRDLGDHMASDAELKANESSSFELTVGSFIVKDLTETKEHSDK